MKQFAKDLFFAAGVGILLPGLILNFGAKVRRETLQEGILQESTASAAMPVKVRRPDGSVQEQDMDAYLVGVILEEMPASFEAEALKAQSVVARTYAGKAYTGGGKHGDGSVCTEPACCQGYCSEEEYMQQGGRPEEVEKIRSAVLETSGQVLTYEGELIEATYFSCSGGSTEDAVAVWGTDYPYLQSVDSPGEENAAHYENTELFTREVLEEKLKISLTGQPENWVRTVSYTRGGGVDTVCIGGTFFTGTEIRQKLGLRSTAFSTKAEGEFLAVITRGYGHRVGMSQYGADAMAVAGSSCQEILMHYYQGAQITKMDGEFHNWQNMQ